MTSVAEAVRTPYKGLSPFDDTELDALLFFGRERETEIVVANALASRLTVLYGPSGVGKSSLLRAGVVREMRRMAETEPLAVAYYSSWSGDPVTGIEDAAKGALADAFGGDPGDAPGDLVDRLDAWTAALGGELCLVLDQFEELFLYHEEGGLLELLPELVTRPGLRVNVVLGIRDDELAKLDVFKARITGLFSNYLRLDLLDRESARAAILGPLERYNALEAADIAIEPELVESVLGEVAAGRIDPGRSGRATAWESSEDRSRIETPYLQLVMQKLWDVERERRSDVLRLATFAELGGAQLIVEDHLEHAMDALSPSQRDVAAGMFDHLVTPSGAKIAHAIADLASFAHVAAAEVQPVLSSLSRERILRPTGENGHTGDRYEIYHDVLAGAVLAWRARHEAETAIARERAASRRRQRRLAILVAIAFLAFALMSALAAYALSQRSTARHQAALALVQQKRAERAAHTAQAATLSARSSRRAAEASARHSKALSTRNAQIAAAERKQKDRADAEAANVKNTNEQLLEKDTELGQKNAALQHQTNKAQASATAAQQATMRANRQKQAALAARTDALHAKAVALHAKADAVRARTATKAGFLLQRALAELQKDPKQSVKDALASTNFARTANSESVLRTALLAFNEVAEVPTRGAVAQVAYSPDDTRIAAADATGALRIFDVATHKTRTLQNGAPLTGVAWAHDGRELAAAATDGKIRIWSLDAPGAPVRVLDQGGPVRSVEYSPDGRLLLTAGGNGARLWDAASGVLLRTLPDSRVVLSASFSPDGSLIVMLDNSPTARVWDVDGQPVKELTQQRATITSAAFSPDGSLIVTGSRDNTGRIWESRTGVVKATLEGHTSQITSVAFSPAGDRVATGSVDGRARLWDLAGRPVDIVDGAAASVSFVAFSPDGQSLVLTSTSGNVVTSGQAQFKQALVGHNGPVAMAAFAHDGLTVATAGSDGMRVWDPHGEGVLRGIHTFAGAATAVAFDPTGRFVASAGVDGTVFVQRPNGKPVRTIQVGALVVSASWARNDVLFVATKDGRVHLYPGGAPTAERTIDAGGPIVAAAVRRDGKVVATAGTDGVVRTWSADGQPQFTLPKLPNLTAVALDPKHGLLAASSGKLVVVFDAATGAQLASLAGHTDTVTGLAFSPDGTQVTSSSRDHDARVWDLRGVHAGSTHVKVLHRHTAFVSGVAYSFDGRWIATAGPAKAGLWSATDSDLPGGNFLQFLRGNQAPILSVAFSPRGWQLASAARDGSVRIFDCKLCGRLRQLESTARARLRALAR